LLERGEAWDPNASGGGRERRSSAEMRDELMFQVKQVYRERIGNLRPPEIK
jgi:hypothetical protein